MRDRTKANEWQSWHGMQGSQKNRIPKGYLLSFCLKAVQEGDKKKPRKEINRRICGKKNEKQRKKTQQNVGTGMLEPLCH